MIVQLGLKIAVDYNSLINRIIQTC